jgi:hypothetical protein
LKTHERYRSSYLRESIGTAWARRWEELRFELDNPGYTIQTTDHVIKVQPRLAITSKRFHYKLHISVDGEKGTVRDIKKLIK